MDDTASSDSRVNVDEFLVQPIAQHLKARIEQPKRSLDAQAAVRMHVVECIALRSQVAPRVGCDDALLAQVAFVACF